MTDDTRDDPEEEPLVEALEGSADDRPPGDDGPGSDRSDPSQPPADHQSDSPGETTEPADERAADRGGQPFGGRSAGELVELAALAGLLVLGAIALFGFYDSASTAISRLVTAEYQPMFQAAFDLVILLAAGIGISTLLRRRSGSSDGTV